MSNIKVTFYLSTEAVRVNGELRTGAGLLAVAEQEGRAPYTRYYNVEDINSSMASITVLIEAYSSIRNKCDVTIVTDSSYIHSLLKYKEAYSKNYRRKDGKQMANVNLVKELYKCIDSKVDLVGLPYSYLSTKRDTVIFKIKQKIFKDLQGGL